jgi:outer membrane protein
VNVFRRVAASPHHCVTGLRHLRPALTQLWVLFATLVVPATGLDATLAQASSRRLSLQETIERTLHANTSILLAARQLEASDGRRIAAAAVFDPVFGTAIAGSQNQELLRTSSGTPTGSALVTNTTAYELGLSKTTNFGILLQPSVSVTSSSARLPAAIPSNSATVNLDVIVPLLRDRGGRETSAGERAAQAEYSAGALNLQQAVAVNVLDAVSAYWNYVAARLRLDVFITSEQHAERLVAETRTLVKAEERPASDLNQVLANLSSKRVARITGEQSLLENRRRLGLTMGLDAKEIAVLPEAGDSLPRARIFAPDSIASAAFVQQGLVQRPEIPFRQQQERAARVLLDAADIARRPRLDLALSVGYAGLQSGAGFNRYFAPLYRNVPGANAMFKLQYRFGLGNMEARGAMAQRSAEHAQAQLSEIEMRREVESGVRVAVEALRRNASARVEAGNAVELYGATVDAEKRKNQLGMGTLFDVIIAEDNLTNAMLNEVATRVSYAVGIANLRYEMGTLIDTADVAPEVVAQRVLTPP